MREPASISKTTAVPKTVKKKSKPPSEALALAMQHLIETRAFTEVVYAALDAVTVAGCKPDTRKASAWIREHHPEVIATYNAKNLAALSLSRLGAGRGGHARAASLSPKRRSQIAKRAARARWGKKSDRS